jgi:hypothetical protein
MEAIRKLCAEMWNIRTNMWMNIKVVSASQPFLGRHEGCGVAVPHTTVLHLR